MAKLPDLDLDLKLPKPPFWLIAGFIIFVILTWIPLALIARARVSKSEEPRVHLFLDMDEQVKKGAQETSPVFQDRRAMRGRTAGTVARGELRADDHYYRGYRMVSNEDGEQSAEFIDGFPDQITIDRRFVERGRRQYTSFCYPCHGKAGYGNGPVHQRATSLQQSGGTNTLWIPPTSLHLENIRQKTDGYLFFTIGNGVRNMPAYGSQIEVEDRWSIVAYIRAMQLAEQYPYENLSDEQKQQLGSPDGTEQTARRASSGE